MLLAIWEGIAGEALGRATALFGVSGAQRREGTTLRGVDVPGIGTGVNDAARIFVGVLGVEARAASAALRSDIDCQPGGLLAARSLLWTARSGEETD